MIPPTGWNRLAQKTFSGSRDRTPTCRGPTNRISDRRETDRRAAACGIDQRAKSLRIAGAGLGCGGLSPPRPCPWRGFGVIIIETLARDGTPKHRATPAPATRIDAPGAARRVVFFGCAARPLTPTLARTRMGWTSNLRKIEQSLQLCGR